MGKARDGAEKAQPPALKERSPAWPGSPRRLRTARSGRWELPHERAERRRASGTYAGAS